jgi:hypothetical protein
VWKIDLKWALGGQRRLRRRVPENGLPERRTRAENYIFLRGHKLPSDYQKGTLVACSNTRLLAERFAESKRVLTSARQVDKFAGRLVYCVFSLLYISEIPRLEMGKERIWMPAGEANNSLECKCGVNEVLKGPPFITLLAV